jgi:iron complex outermembrane receptor protein
MKSISFKRHIAYACIASFAMSSAHSQVSGPTPSKSVQSEVNNVLTPVVVTATRFEQPLSEVSVVVDIIGRKQIEQSGASNIVEFLDTVSGLSVNRLYGRAGIDASVDIGSLGTSGAQNVLVLIDGQRVNSSDSSGVRFAQVPMSSIERIEIRKANVGVLYGDRAQGGVINIITRTGQGKDVHLSTGSFGYKKADGLTPRQVDHLPGYGNHCDRRCDSGIGFQHRKGYR